jgi:phosphate acetyltransferase
MGRSVYIATVEGFTGKSAVALGVLEQFSKRVERVAVFRPVVRSDPGEGPEHDYVLDLLVSHEAVQLSYSECAGVTYDDLHADPDAAMDRIVDRFHRVAEQCDAVVVVGSDYTDVGAPAEFAVNARIAANIGSPVLLVLNGYGRDSEQLRVAADLAAAELRANHGSLFAVIANRVDRATPDAAAKALTRDDVPAYAIPEQPLLSAPSVAALTAACDGRRVSGD